MLYWCLYINIKIDRSDSITSMFYTCKFISKICWSPIGNSGRDWGIQRSTFTTSAGKVDEWRSIRRKKKHPIGSRWKHHDSQQVWFTTAIVIHFIEEGLSNYSIWSVIIMSSLATWVLTPLAWNIKVVPFLSQPRWWVIWGEMRWSFMPGSKEHDGFQVRNLLV